MTAPHLLTALIHNLHPGLRCWHDTYYYAGWRIQKHAKSGQFRLAPPSPFMDVFTAPSFDECLSALARRRAKGLAPARDHLVIIVPGLNGLPLNYEPLARAIRRDGYDCMIWHYGSFHGNAAAHAENLAALTARLDGVKTVSFVTHSLGGLILRVLLASPATMPSVPVGRIVMIAPPHGGSFMANLVHDRLKLKGLFTWVCGHVGYDLTSAGAAALPPVTAPVGIITGGIDRTDGWVEISSALIPAAVDTAHIRGWPHTAMLWAPVTARQVLSFLRDGRFLKDAKA